MSDETVNKLSMLMLYNKSMMHYYDLIINYELEHIGKKTNYGELGYKMMEIINEEQKIYNNLSIPEINQMLHFVLNAVTSPNGRQRIIGHLADVLQKLLMSKIESFEDCSIDDFSYLSMIDSKIDIDSLIKINVKLNTTDGIDKKSTNELLKYWTLSKFVKLSRNFYVEKFAIKNDFDVFRMSTMPFEHIKGNLDADAITSIERKLIIAIESELMALENLENVKIDPLVRTYTAMTVFINNEIRLGFLEIEALNEVKSYFSEKYGNTKNEQLLYVKELIRKKEEELSD